MVCTLLCFQLILAVSSLLVYRVSSFSRFNLITANQIARSTQLSGGLNLDEIYQNKLGLFDSAIVRFDYANSLDPNTDVDDTGNKTPRELLYAKRLYKEVENLCTESPSEHLLLAARSQHIMRWKIPRESYSMDKKGYLEWRSKLKLYHAAMSSNILVEVGYDENTIELVKNIILKKNFPNDPEVRVMEDSLCLVFLKYQLSAFSLKNSEDKVVNAIKKSWNKMSENGRKAALNVPYSDTCKVFINKALTS